MDPRIIELFAGSNFGQVATLMADGSPHVVPVWVGVEQQRVCFVKEVGSIGLKNIERDPRVAVSVQDKGEPYRSANIRGRVVEIRRGEGAWSWMDHAAQRYTGARYPGDPWEAALVIVEVERERFVHYTEFSAANGRP